MPWCRQARARRESAPETEAERDRKGFLKAKLSSDFDGMRRFSRLKGVQEALAVLQLVPAARA
jgi:hypothetical protein